MIKIIDAVLCHFAATVLLVCLCAVAFLVPYTVTSAIVMAIS